MLASVRYAGRGSLVTALTDVTHGWQRTQRQRDAPCLIPAARWGPGVKFTGRAETTTIGPRRFAAVRRPCSAFWALVSRAQRLCTASRRGTHQTTLQATNSTTTDSGASRRHDCFVGSSQRIWCFQTPKLKQGTPLMNTCLHATTTVGCRAEN